MHLAHRHFIMVGSHRDVGSQKGPVITRSGTLGTARQFTLAIRRMISFRVLVGLGWLRMLVPMKGKEKKTAKV